jgi:hypothetical protein
MNWKIILKSTVLFAVVSVAIRKVFSNEFDMGTVSQAIFTGLFSSFLFFTLGIWLMKKLAKKLGETIPDVELSPDEKQLLKGGANHLRGREAVGGMLTLTDKRLIFKPHRFNIQKRDSEFPVREIKSVSHHKKYKQIFVLEFSNNEVHKFVVDSPADWIRSISLQP